MRECIEFGNADTSPNPAVLFQDEIASLVGKGIAEGRETVEFRIEVCRFRDIEMMNDEGFSDNPG